MDRIDQWLFVGIVVLAVALTGNAIAGPLLLEVVEYPFSETLVNQTIGLEAVSLGVVVPWCLVAAILLYRGHAAGRVLVIPPAAYAAYMFVQYIVGPQYLVYRPIVVIHVAMFVLSAGLVLGAWVGSRTSPLPRLSNSRNRVVGVGVLVLALFIASRYIELFAGMWNRAALPPAYSGDPTMYWSIVFLDLGVIVPTTAATGVALFYGVDWAKRAVYGVVGWFVLVPISVATMAYAMVLNNDPYATMGEVWLFGGAALVFITFAAWVYRPLVVDEEIDRQTRDDDRVKPTQ